ncbi:putative protein DUF4159 [Leeuwenhoekiella aestuarii]|uniref:DUF4159 domain-containing protein n=1 Tax=Leeuwenhoekiella aestuarii TaxID=2249426 RepID=A0A4Q0NWE1_9FLAO|nr:DUF4159 domain-containing protein [Leeuwenhoekiella aestuarii]RXG15702.1 putative protein DUF4159 [Leeuwenhoekiella aestuarii]RXG17189.1 putative protein DUF4159 [Leeuwenhoekiella aestuarii]
MYRFILSALLTVLLTASIEAQQIAVLQYEGGGDWYGNPTSLPNLVKFCNTTIHTALDNDVATVTSTDPSIMQYPFVHMTGHGNVFFSDEALQNLRNYLNSGGFLHIDDNYGIDNYLRPQLKKLYPQEELIELPADHPIFSTAFEFKEGLPKIHEHDGLRPQAFGLFKEDRMVILYTLESDLGDGWESQEIHSDPPAVREKALKMGANIIKYAFEN